MMNYFADKFNAAKHAKQVNDYVTTHYANEVAELVKNSRVFPDSGHPTPENRPYLNDWDLTVVQETTADAIFRESENKIGKIAALNFASYKQPGGMFLEGSKAQEECLCHESWLYPILSSQRLREEFYEKNIRRLNRGTYHSNLIYTPDVPFVRGNSTVLADVITCAAPNKRAAQKYCGVSDYEITVKMKERIEAVLAAAAEMKADVLILGAFGCGVFGNDLAEVCGIFKDFLYGKYVGCFKYVVFAIPDDPSVRTATVALGFTTTV